MHRRLDARARLVDRVHVGLTEHHEVDVLRGRTSITEQPSGEGAVEERGRDPVDAGKLLGQHHQRPGHDRKDLAQGANQRTLVVGADQPGAAHLPLTQDAGVHQARDLAVGGRVGQAGSLGQVSETQLVAGEQQGGQEACLTVRPEDRSEEGRLGSHITEVILHHIDSQRAAR